MHALALIADCGGPMFRSYVNPTLEQVVKLVLTVPSAITEVHQCLGKCLAALITSIGPELQGKSIRIILTLDNFVSNATLRLGVTMYLTLMLQ